jgi:hypothetical protein
MGENVDMDFREVGKDGVDGLIWLRTGRGLS